MSVEANKTLTWGQQIGATVGGAVGGPIGALIGSILGQILESAVGDARAGIVGDYAVKAAELLTNSNFLQQRENEIYVNHDLENAGRTAEA